MIGEFLYRVLSKLRASEELGRDGSFTMPPLMLFKTIHARVQLPGERYEMRGVAILLPLPYSRKACDLGASWRIGLRVGLHSLWWHADTRGANRWQVWRGSR